MAASISGALKAFLESQSLGVAVYRDQAPANSTPPYVSIDEAIAVVPDKLEDGAASTVREHVTVNVWQQWKNLLTGALTESHTLPGAVLRALQGSRLLTSGTGAPPLQVYAVLVRNEARLLEIDDNVVHHSYWVEVWRRA